MKSIERPNYRTGRFSIGVLLLALSLATSAPVGSRAGGGPDVVEGLDGVDGLYVAVGVCPFECCTYGRWTAMSETPYYSGERDTSPIATIAAGDEVEGITGNVYVAPLRVDVLASPSRGIHGLAVGDQIFLLDYVGEGYQRAWIDGRIDSVDVADFRKKCEEPTPACWWRLERPLREQYQEWRAMIRLPDGREVWTDKPASFDGVDACS